MVIDLAIRKVQLCVLLVPISAVNQKITKDKINISWNLKKTHLCGQQGEKTSSSLTYKELFTPDEATINGETCWVNLRSTIIFIYRNCVILKSVSNRKRKRDEE